MAAGEDVTTDLVAEHDALDQLVATLDPGQFALATPSPRWTVADQIGHLTYFDTTAALALRDPAAFSVHRAELISGFDDATHVEHETLGRYRRLPPADLLAEWRARRADLAAAAGEADPAARVEWYGPSMGLRSFLTARLMETWAHGQDVADAVGASRAPSDRLRHVAQLGVITRGWSYLNRGREQPDVGVRVELVAPSGTTWVWGEADAPERITGPAEAFCLVVTQRRHVDDTGLAVDGAAAREWMELAQAFAGTATHGPAPRSRTLRSDARGG